MADWDFDDFELEHDLAEQAAYRAEDVLIPYRVMYEREEKRLEVHSIAMVSLKTGSQEWKWRKELARRAHERSIVWSRYDNGTIINSSD